MKTTKLMQAVLSLAAASVVGLAGAHAAADLITYQSIYRSWEVGVSTDRPLNYQLTQMINTYSTSGLDDVTGNNGPFEGWQMWAPYIDATGYDQDFIYRHAHGSANMFVHSRSHEDFFAFGSSAGTFPDEYAVAWANSTCNLDFTVSQAIPYTFRFDDSGHSASWLTLTSGGSTLVDLSGGFNVHGLLAPGTYSLRSGYDIGVGRSFANAYLWVEIPAPGASLLLALSGGACILSRGRRRER